MTQQRTRRTPRGYDRHWWQGTRSLDDAAESYWALTRRPFVAFLFVLPLLVAYEFGVVWTSAANGRAGVDSWVRGGLQAIGISEPWLPPVALAAGLLIWQATDKRPARLRVTGFAGMAIESALLAVALVGLSRVVDLALSQLEHSRSGPALAVGASHPAAPYLGYLGAGIYEEAVFRLALIPLLLGTLRLLLVPKIMASTLAVTGSALLFSMAHHAGAPGEAFTWYAFIFRWFAGVYFAWVFVLRGFGVAVGTHVLYDCAVGLMQSGSGA